MKRNNFEIVSEILIDVAGRKFDLHASREFLGFEYDIQKRSVVLRWGGVEIALASPENDGARVSLKFTGVSVFSVSPRDARVPFWEDKHLDVFGFLHPEDINVMDGFLPLSLARVDYHIIFLFYSGSSVKIYSEEVEAVVGQ